MPCTLIQINESIAKLVTLMVEGLGAKLKSLNVIPTLYCDNSLTMKYKNILKILYSPPSHIMKFMFSKLFVHLII
jgi:hypothetical protein